MNAGEVLLRSGLVAAIASAAFHVGALRGRRSRAGSWAFAIHAALMVGALAMLAALFLGRRFDYVYVAQYSSRALSPALTLAALWAGQEGSILLWVAIGAVIGLALLRQPGSLARPALFFVSLAQISLLTLLAVRSPFATAASAPADGQGLNPLLEDPWMVIHPPVLFLGYAALLVPYALAAAALVRGEYREWNRMTWPWALFGVVTLGAGIALGGVWAYKVLGWGGYWGWDPVENASLVPWLVAVALLHGLLIQRTTGSLVRTNLALAIAGWATVLGGTYLTRSGVLQDFSVHSFADSGLNAPLTATLALFALLGAGLLAARWRRVDAGDKPITSLSRESALWLGMITVLALATLVAFGTSAPLLTSLAGKPAGVQASFYERVSLPVGIALVLLMGVSPALRWFRQSGASWLAGLAPGLAGALVVATPAALAGVRAPGWLALIGVAGFALGVNVAVALRHFRRGWMYGAGYLGHAGLAVMVLGIALSASLGRSERVELRRGQSVESLGYTLTYNGEEHTRQGGHELRIAVQSKGWRLDARPVLLPSPRDQGVVRKPAISGARELYLSPVEFREPAPGEGDVTWLEKGTPLEVGDARYTFTGFRMESGVEFMAYADLDVAKQGRTWKVSPAISAGPSGNRSLPVEVPTVGSITLARIDADRRRVAVSLPDARVAGVAVVDLSTKPFINLVWIGVLLAFLGTALAGIRRASEKLPAHRDRPVASRPSRARGHTQTPQGEESSMLIASSDTNGRAGRLPAALLALGATFVTVTGAFAAGSAATLPDTTKPVMFLKETVVTGSRYPRAYYESPQALSFVTRTQLRQQQPTVVGDVLAGLPGVDNSKDSPWEQRPVLRGLSGQRVLVMMDGYPMNSARGNGPHPSLVDPAQVERIEVVRGPSSVAYGSDALGGVINIITREAPLTGSNRSLAGSATVGGSSADAQRTGYLELIPRMGRFSAFVSSGARKADDFDAPGGTVKNSAFTDYNALANLRYDFSDRMALKGGWQLYRGSDIGIPGLSFEMPGAQQEFQFTFYDRDAAHLELERNGRGWLTTSSAKFYWQREHRNFFSDQAVDASMYNAFGIPPRPGSTSAQTTQDRYLDVDTYGFQAQAASARTERHHLTAGVDVARDVTGGDNVRFRTYHDATGAPVGATGTRVTQSLPDGRFDNYGGYGQGEWYLHPQWTLSAGGRYTHYRYRTDAGLAAPAAGPPPAQPTYFDATSTDDDALAGSMGLVYALRPALRLSANVANGYRQPNAQELFFSGPASVGFVVGNSNLKPEKSVSSEVGLRWGPGSFAVSGNLFYSTYDDLIDAVSVRSVPAAGGQPTYQYVNISTARIWGAEGEGEWRFHPQWLARAQASGAVGDITSSDAIQQLYGVTADTAPLPNVPPFRGSASLRWRDRNDRFWVEPAVRYSWRTNRLPLPTPGVPQIGAFKTEWIVGDLMAGARFGGQRVLVGVRNFADTPYRLPLGSLDEPGISFVGSISADF